ncbi:MAG: hypothetical protein M3Z05_04585 [Gemmatimonadota bacterium]|nr:hypothetical protein [Gemmatimonadota bacterium]
MARLDVLVAHAGVDSPADVPDALLAAGERIIAKLLRPEGSTRDSALDLLAADALMTYAMEAAAENTATLDHRAAGSMTRISRLAEAAASTA